MSQSPNTSQDVALLSSKVRPPSVKTVQPIRYQPPAWRWRWKQSPMSSAGLPQEVTVKPHMPSSSQIQWAWQKWNWKAKLECVSGRPPPSKPPVGVLHGHSGVNRAEQIDLRAKQPSHMACIQEDWKCWGAWDISCGHKAKGHYTIDRLEERGMERGIDRRSSLKGWERAIVSQTNIGTVSKATLGKRLRDGMERLWAFPSA